MKRKTSIIAELGWNFQGDMNLAQSMIESAAENGADYVKFQTWSTKHLKDGPWMTDGRKEIYEKAELSEENHHFLKKICDDNKVKFLTSCFNSNDAEFISKLTSVVKIPSTEIANIELLTKINNNFKEVFLSTGASTQAEIQTAKETLNSVKLTLLHCVCSYPCLPENVNLPRIAWLRKNFKTKVGYSGHMPGINDAIASLDYNVTLIEKHFTIDNNLPGRDNKFAILPVDLKNLSNYINDRELMNKKHAEEFQDCEKEMRNVYRGRWQN